MEQKIKMEKPAFERMEKEIMKEVVSVSKSIIETFKFKMIFGSEVKACDIDKTNKEVKKFRKENWDTTLSRREAYKKYVSLY